MKNNVVIPLSELAQQEEEYFKQFDQETKRRKIMFAGLCVGIVLGSLGVWKILELIPTMIKLLMGV